VTALAARKASESVPSTTAVDEFIDVADVQVVPRGRKPQIDADLADLLSRLPEGKAVRLSAKFGNVNGVEARAKVSQTIRKHWAHVRQDKCRIDYTTDGVPQVRARI
jgi:hypothetical protein